MNTCFILIFESVHKVLKTEKILTAHDVKYDIIPTPKEFSSDCGMSVRITENKTNIEFIKKTLLSQNIVFKIYVK